MASKQSIRVKLDYPLNRVAEPVIYHLVTEFRLIPNIRRAQIDSHVGGWIALELEGTPEDLEAGMNYLRDLGITVTPIEETEDWNV